MPDKRVKARNSVSIQLALETLGSFGFNAVPLIGWIRTTLVSYLEDEDRDIRKAAALTISSLMVSVCSSDSKAATQVGDIISTLLAVTNTDTGNIVIRS